MAPCSTSCTPRCCLVPVLVMMRVVVSQAASPQLRTTEKPYNCSEQYTDCKHCLQVKWTQSKLDFCCKNAGIGCKPKKPEKPEKPEQPEKPRKPSTGTILFSAANSSRCVYFKTKVRKGLRPLVSECSNGEVQPTKFQLPEGNMGPIKVAEDPRLCLNAPGHGVLQLWPCNDTRSMHRDFTLQADSSAWIGVPHFDLADEHDAENMDASDLKAVIQRAQELGYAGFSVFHGRAFFKNVRHLTLKDLKYMGKQNPNVFYLRRRQHSSDVSIRLTWQPDTCILVPTKLGESQMGMAPCQGPNRGSQSATGSVWTIGMLFHVERDIPANTEDDSSEKDHTAKSAFDPAFHSLRFLHQQPQQQRQQEHSAASVHWQ